jgi:hypothetical protein
MNELENLVFRNGRFYDKRTNNRVFVKAESGFAKPPLKQPTMPVEGVGEGNVPVNQESSTESLTEPLQGALEATSESIVKPPVKRTGGRPKKTT